MVLFNKIIGQKRKTGISCHVFSFQQSLSFVERFVEKMLSLKYNHGKTKSARIQKRNVFSTDKNEM